MNLNPLKLSDEGYIFSVNRFSIQDGPGIRTTIFFKGCPLKCRWCHNPEGLSPDPQLYHWQDRCLLCFNCLRICPRGAISAIRGSIVIEESKCDHCGLCVKRCPPAALEIIGSQVTVADMIRIIDKDLIFYDDSGGGVTFSGGEPFMQPDFLKSLLFHCKRHGFHTAVDTCGHVDTRILLDLSDLIDVFLYDLKLMDDHRHQLFTGFSNRLIIENVIALAKKHRRIIIRVPLIPGINDDEHHIDQIAKFVSSLRTVDEIDLLPYHNHCVNKYERFEKKSEFMEVVPSANGRIYEIRELLQNFHFRVTVGG